MKIDPLDKRDYPNGYTIEIHSDTEPINPRTESDNFGVMACFHERYDLGDDKNVHGLNMYDFDGWDEMADHIVKELGAVVILPLYLYDHSGITISTGPFSCHWDSGQVGFIYVTKERLREEYSCKRISKKILVHAEQILRSEVKTYDNYLTGNVFGVVVKAPAIDGNDEDDREKIHSCWGYFPDPDLPYARRFDEMYAEGESQIKWDVKKKVEDAKQEQREKYYADIVKGGQMIIHGILGDEFKKNEENQVLQRIADETSTPRIT